MTPPARRPPPLLVMAAAGLVVVLGAGVLLIATRGGERGVRERGERVFVPRSEPRAAASDETRTETGTGTETETGTGGAGSGEEIPIWARPPRVTVQPFPEGARFDPPMPPVKIPPEMLVPPAPTDAATGGAP